MQWMVASLVSVSMGLLAQGVDVVPGDAAALEPAVAEREQAPAAAEAAVAPGGAPAAQEAPLELGRWTLGASFGEDLQILCRAQRRRRSGHHHDLRLNDWIDSAGGVSLESAGA